MVIDTHCHLLKEDYENVDEIIKSMEDNIMIVSGYDENSNLEVLELCAKYSNIYGMIGYHPSNIDTVKDQNLKLLEEQLRNNKIVALGEIGLDYHWSDNKKEQQEMFKKQITLANKLNKPIVIHSRDAIADTYNILKEYGNINGVMHCFSGSLNMAKQFINLGMKLGIGGVITFKNAKTLIDVVDNVDLTDLVLETDSPYLTPEPYRGKKNEPKNVLLIAKKIAEIKNINIDEVISTTTNNALQQFDISC